MINNAISSLSLSLFWSEVGEKMIQAVYCFTIRMQANKCSVALVSGLGPTLSFLISGPETFLSSLDNNENHQFYGVSFYTMRKNTLYFIYFGERKIGCAMRATHHVVSARHILTGGEEADLKYEVLGTSICAGR